MIKAWMMKKRLVSNANIDDEDMADITDWADGDSGTGDSSQIAFDGQSCMKLNTGATVNGYSQRNQDIGTFGARTVFSLRIYCDKIGTKAADDNFAHDFFNGVDKLTIFYYSDGLYIRGSGVLTEVGTDLVIQDVWQEWTYDVNWETKRLNVYLNGYLVGSGIDFTAADSTANGKVVFGSWSGTTANLISYVDWFKAGSDFA